MACRKGRVTMQIFDILGPVMIGPSSSHTAGIVRIGNVARSILGHTPSHARILFHGSLAKTYRGHGSDRAIVAGLLGFDTDDMRIRDSLTLAEEYGLSYEIETTTIEGAHPNTVLLFLDSLTLQAASVGGGNILVQKIDDIDVRFKGYHDTLITLHKDSPGVIASVTNFFAVKEINIADMKVYRDKKGGRAIMLIEVDDRIDNCISRSIGQLPEIEQVTLIRGLFHD